MASAIFPLELLSHQTSAFCGGDAKKVVNALQIITISGRTIKKEAQASPQYAENAIQKINDLLAMLPQQEVQLPP